jgi:type VI secretion system protein ImpN
MQSEPDGTLELIASRYRDLYEALTSDWGMPLGMAERGLLIDRVRDALDRMSARLEPSAPTLIANSFWQDGLLHEGEATQIFRLRHRDLDQLYAMKTLHPRHADSPEARSRLLRESAILSRISHPAVIRHHVTLRLEDGRPGLVLEYLLSSLAESAKASHSAEDISRLIFALLSGLQVVHEAGYVHADICPANLLIAADGELKIADFGISVPMGTAHSTAGYTRAFSPEFAAPEQIAGEPLDARSDIYAVGRVLTFLADHAPLSTEEGGLFRQVAGDFTRKDPLLRPRSCAEARDFLHATGISAR